MSDAIVESRRFRTWDESRDLEADHRVRLLIKAQFLRYRHNWPFWVVFGLAVLGAIAAMMAPFGELDAIGYVDGATIAYGYFGAAAPLAGIAIILFGSPTIAEDLRFNAPLFYFSRPVRVWDYVLAKVGFLLALLGIVIGMGLVTTLLGTLVTIRDADVPRRPWMSPEYHQELVLRAQEAGVTHVGDWLVLSLILVTGTLSVAFFLSTAMIAVSSCTRRAWHAAVGFLVLIGTWGFLGIGLGFVMADNAWQLLWGPFGWIAATTFLPADAYFADGEWTLTRGIAGVAPLAHLLMIASGLAFVRFTRSRVAKMEGAL